MFGDRTKQGVHVDVPHDVLADREQPGEVRHYAAKPGDFLYSSLFSGRGRGQLDELKCGPLLLFDPAEEGTHPAERALPRRRGLAMAEAERTGHGPANATGVHALVDSVTTRIERGSADLFRGRLAPGFTAAPQGLPAIHLARLWRVRLVSSLCGPPRHGFPPPPVRTPQPDPAPHPVWGRDRRPSRCPGPPSPIRWPGCGRR